MKRLILSLLLSACSYETNLKIVEQKVLPSLEEQIIIDKGVKNSDESYSLKIEYVLNESKREIDYTLKDHKIFWCYTDFFKPYKIKVCNVETQVTNLNSRKCKIEIENEETIIGECSPHNLIARSKLLEIKQ